MPPPAVTGAIKIPLDFESEPDSKTVPETFRFGAALFSTGGDHKPPQRFKTGPLPGRSLTIKDSDSLDLSTLVGLI